MENVNAQTYQLHRVFKMIFIPQYVLDCQIESKIYKWLSTDWTGIVAGSSLFVPYFVSS